MGYREIEKEKKRRGDCDMLCYAMYVSIELLSGLKSFFFFKAGGGGGRGFRDVDVDGVCVGVFALGDG